VLHVYKSYSSSNKVVLISASRYVEMVNRKQDYDLNQSFAILNESQWFFDNEEPKSKSGKKMKLIHVTPVFDYFFFIKGRAKGLSLMLDAHTDLVESGTVSSDINVSKDSKSKDLPCQTCLFFAPLTSLID